MKLAEFKLLTLEERLDYLFEHSVKDSEQCSQDAQDMWSQDIKPSLCIKGIVHAWNGKEDRGRRPECTCPECQPVSTRMAAEFPTCEHGRLLFDYCEPCGRIHPVL